MLVGAFNKEKALVGAFSGHCETLLRSVDTSRFLESGHVNSFRTVDWWIFNVWEVVIMVDGGDRWGSVGGGVGGRQGLWPHLQRSLLLAAGSHLLWGFGGKLWSWDGDYSDCCTLHTVIARTSRYRSHQEPGTSREWRQTLALFYALSQFRDKNLTEAQLCLPYVCLKSILME